MKTIRSRDNAFVKQLIGLAHSSRDRKKAGLTVLDGIHLVRAYHDAIGATQALAIAESALAEPEVAALLAAAGISDVLLSKTSAFAWSPKVLRAAQGAHFLVNIVEGVDLREWLHAWQQQEGAQSLALSPHAERTLYDCDLRRPSAFLIGNEGAGLSAELLRQASLQVSIPMPGKIESLNVAAAAAVCLFELARQRR